MKGLAVLIGPEVRSLIEQQVLFIAADSVDNAVEWEDRLHRAIAKLGASPGFALDEDASDRAGFPVHKLVFERTYLIHYVIDEPAGVVRVVGFCHGARLPRRGEH